MKLRAENIKQFIKTSSLNLIASDSNEVFLFLQKFF
jgi:hypothetical protein